MRFLFVASVAPRPFSPTFGIFVHQMATALQKAGHSVDVLVPVRVFPPVQLLKAAAFPRRWPTLFATLRLWTDTWLGATGEHKTDCVRYWYRRFSSLPSLSRRYLDGQHFLRGHGSWLRSVTARNQYDFVLGHFVETAPVVIWLAQTLKVPGSVYVHEDFEDLIERAPVDLPNSWLTKCSAVLTNSHRSQAQLARALGAEVPVHVVQLGIDELFREFCPLRAAWGDEVRLVSVSRFAERKNQELLLRLLARWTAQGRAPSLSLALVGDQGANRARVEALCRVLGLDARVAFVDATSLHVVRDELRKADIFVFPSRFESFGIVLLEAASQGLPVLATPEIGAARELELLGFPVNQFDPASLESLETALSGLLNAPESALQSAQRLQAHIRERFSWAATAERLAACALDLGAGTSREGED